LCPGCSQSPKSDGLKAGIDAKSITSRDSSTVWVFCEVGQIGLQFIPDAAEECQPFFFGAVQGGGVVEAMMQPLRRPKEHRATFFGVVADGNHVIELLPLKFIDML